MLEKKIVDRELSIFHNDLEDYKSFFFDVVSSSRFLVIGGAGTIGSAVVQELFKRKPKLLHVIDINENNLVELVRDLRSSFGYIDGEFRTYVIDCGSRIFEDFMQVNQPYDYILNLSAMKHVRSERDPFTLLRLIETNISNPYKISKMIRKFPQTKYFCVSTDKAANPVNMMGASKRIMEMSLWADRDANETSMARFANVLFSDGSLPNGFEKRLSKRQPISAPLDVKRYFVTKKEAGELCLLSALLGGDREIYVPKQTQSLKLVSFADIAVSYLDWLGLRPAICATEDEARSIDNFNLTEEWPCYFFSSDTTGEKSYEEFYTRDEFVDMTMFNNLGVIKYEPTVDTEALSQFHELMAANYISGQTDKKLLLQEFKSVLTDFDHFELNKNLDEKM